MKMNSKFKPALTWPTALLILIFSTQSPALAQIPDLLDEARYEEALEEIKAARDLGEDNVALGIYAAKAYDKIIRQSGPLKRFRLTKKLRAELHHLLELDPEQLFALEELADFYHYVPAIGGGDEKKSRIYVERLKAASLVRYHIMKGRHAHDADDLPGAIRHFEAAKTLAPDDIEIRKGLGNVLFFDKQYPRAFSLFDGIIAQGNAKADIYYHAARTAQRGKMETAKAYAYLDHYITNATAGSTFSKAKAHLRLGFLYLKDGEKTKARTHFKQALELNPKLKQAKAALKELDND